MVDCELNDKGDIVIKNYSINNVLYFVDNWR